MIFDDFDYKSGANDHDLIISLLAQLINQGNYLP